MPKKTFNNKKMWAGNAALADREKYVNKQYSNITQTYPIIILLEHLEAK